MPRSRSSLVLFLILLLAPVLAIAAERIVEGIQIEGSTAAANAWFAETVKVGNETGTILYQREEGQREWTPVSTVGQRITALTHYGNQPVALLPDGNWLYVGQSSGQPLPGGGRVVALAGDATSLWAIGDPSSPASTQPATGPSTAPATQTTTAPATRPTQLIVYQLTGGQWAARATLPAAARSERITMGLADGRPVVAFANTETLTALRLNPDGAWADLGQQPSLGQSPREVLANTGRLFIYMAGDNGPDRLLVRADQWLEPVMLRYDAKIRSLGLAGGMLRYTYLDGQAIRQRSISPRNLQPEGDEQDILLPQPTSLQRVWAYLEWVMIGLVGLVVLHTYRQREEYRQLSPDWNKIQLAPFGRRIFAGLIDLMPILVAAVYARLYVGHVETPRDLFIVPKAFQLLVWASCVYLAHTTIIEALVGRSLGKLITRLHVVRLDGGRPSMGALAIRNLLRCVDLVLLFTPIFMFYLPLRQRVGDMAATTMVVADREEDMAGPDA